MGGKGLGGELLSPAIEQHEMRTAAARMMIEGGKKIALGGIELSNTGKIARSAGDVVVEEDLGAAGFGAGALWANGSKEEFHPTEGTSDVLAIQGRADQRGESREKAGATGESGRFAPATSLRPASLPLP